MPIILAYSGEITLSASEKPNDPKNKIYDKTIKAYGETIGELLDNLVEASVTLANDAFEWTLVNRPIDYDMSKDYWYSHYSHPDILKSQIISKASEVHETGGGSSINSIEEIVKYAALSRDITIFGALTNLGIVVRNQDTALPSEAKIHYNGIHEARTLKEMTHFGFSGIELDSIMKTAKNEDLIDAYKSHAKLLEYSSKRKSKVSASKSHWWKIRQ